MMSYRSAMRHQNVVDDCQRISCNKGPSSALFQLSGRCVIVKDIVLGCRMEWSDPDIPCLFDHTWCVYLRQQDNVSMENFVRRVTFRMSPRLPLRLQVADSAPFEITEVLVTDFPIEMQVEYTDPKMTSTTYVFKAPRLAGRSPEETPDKMIFVNPSPAMRLSLAAGNLSTMATATGSTSSLLSVAGVKGLDGQVGDAAEKSKKPGLAVKKHYQ
ncbi:YEATS domain-containing protein 4 [Drosophila miranda]|uniref:YEATS domain-containing protein 4 n=1 Tax=Drosophila miranda TaxID=7229 RepID=UPI0007E75758|nr:YEATS domain-containing protein 4 [Drosophila miranda]